MDFAAQSRRLRRPPLQHGARRWQEQPGSRWQRGLAGRPWPTASEPEGVSSCLGSAPRPLGPANADRTILIFQTGFPRPLLPLRGPFVISVCQGAGLSRVSPEDGHAHAVLARVPRTTACGKPFAAHQQPRLSNGNAAGEGAGPQGRSAAAAAPAAGTFRPQKEGRLSCSLSMGLIA